MDLSPEGGIHGGRVIAEGTPVDLLSNECSVTGNYLSGYIKTSKQ